MQKIVELKPIKESTSDYEKIEARIKAVFKRLIYLPLLKQLNFTQTKILNAIEDLIQALKVGKVSYKGNQFVGRFDARVSKELHRLGAKWDKKTSSYRIEKEDLPYEIRSAISTSEVYFAEKMAAIDANLAQILPENIAEQIKVADLFDSVLWKIEKDFQKSISNITVSPELSKEQRAKIAQEWQNNMDLWIRNFSEKHIKELRKTISDATFAGNRFESLVEGIQSSYGVTARKAKFLARQETNLLVAKFKETRYTAAGVNEYRWGCVKMPHDSSPDQHVPGNVRFYHGILEGQIFRWDNPPVTNKNPERRNNPGQDYNCRCFPRPIVKFGE